MARPTLTPSAYRRVAAVALILLGTIVITGAAVRLTNSGLGCTNWPKCTEQQFHAEFSFHPMVEWLNRMFTGAVSLGVIAAVLGSIWRRPFRRDLVWWSAGLVVGVLAQIVWGGITVLTKLNPWVVAGHFLISMVLIWNAVVLWHRAAQPAAPRALIVSRPVARWTNVSLFLSTIVLVTGTVVTGTGPHGGDETAPRHDFDISTVTRLHGLAVWFLICALVVTSTMAARRNEPEVCQRRLRLTVGLAVAQGAVGYFQYSLGVPAGLVAVHILGATLVVAALVEARESQRAPIVDADTPEAGVATAGAGTVG